MSAKRLVPSRPPVLLLLLVPLLLLLRLRPRLRLMLVVLWICFPSIDDDAAPPGATGAVHFADLEPAKKKSSSLWRFLVAKERECADGTNHIDGLRVLTGVNGMTYGCMIRSRRGGIHWFNSKNETKQFFSEETKKFRFLECLRREYVRFVRG